MIDYLIELDTEILLSFNGLHCRYLDAFMQCFTGRFIWGAMYVAMLYAMIKQYGWKVALCYVVAVALVILIADQMVASCIRPYVERLRPSNLDNPVSAMVHIVDGYRGGRYGFPSCHAANSFALAMITSLIFASRRYTVFVFVWAAINSYTRLYLGVHYPGDLIVGALLGCLIGWVVYAVAFRCIRYKGLSGLTDSCLPSHKHPSDLVIMVGLITCFVIAIISGIKML